MHRPAARPVRDLTVNSIRDHYDQFAWAYRIFWGEHVHHGLFASRDDRPKQAQVALLRLCAHQVEVRPRSRVVDVGCGYGGTARFLAQEYACTVLALTISATQRAIAHKLSRFRDGGRGVHFELANAETYSFPTERFDLVWNMESSEHFFDKPRYFRQVAAALKPGGRIMLAAWTGSMGSELIQKIAGVFLCPELFTVEQYLSCLTNAGMTPVSCLQVGRRVAPTWDICAKRVAAFRPLLRMLRHQYQEFVQGIELMRQGYGSGELSYSLMVAEKR